MNKKGFNSHKIHDNHVEIFIKDKICLIDLEDLNIVNKYRWYLYNGYVVHKNIKIYRLIMNGPSYLLIDHINNNPLDNRKSNLRFATKTLNAQNSVKKDTTCTSKFKGVNFRPERNKWRSYITINKKTIFLGNFNTEKEAAEAYNKAASKYFGEFARLNEI